MNGRGVGFSFRPSFEGELSVDRIPDDFFERVGRRVTRGLFGANTQGRAHYLVRAIGGDSLTFEAAGFLTAYAIGLNHVELKRSAPGVISYRVDFSRWNRYATLHGLALGLAFALASLLPGVGQIIRTTPGHGAVLWSFVAFWSLLWPRILTAVHRPFARNALERILREELSEPPLRAAS